MKHPFTFNGSTDCHIAHQDILPMVSSAGLVKTTYIGLGWVLMAATLYRTLNIIAQGRCGQLPGKAVYCRLDIQHAFIMRASWRFSY